ncbi:MAG: hypothetical protein AAFV80_19240, partial [Bacteroidota bacterium]
MKKTEILDADLLELNILEKGEEILWEAKISNEFKRQKVEWASLMEQAKSRTEVLVTEGGCWIVGMIY